jgi:hypothetical protein
MRIKLQCGDTVGDPFKTLLDHLRYLDQIDLFNRFGYCSNFRKWFPQISFRKVLLCYSLKLKCLSRMYFKMDSNRLKAECEIDV